MSERSVNKTMNAIKIAAVAPSCRMTFVNGLYNQSAPRIGVDQKKNPATEKRPDL